MKKIVIGLIIFISIMFVLNSCGEKKEEDNNPKTAQKVKKKQATPIKKQIIEQKEDKKVQKEKAEEPKTEKIKLKESKPEKKLEVKKTVEVKKDEVSKKVEEDNINPAKLSNDKKGWWFRRNKKHLPPTAQNEIDIAKYDAYYLGNTKEKVVYLTFDNGYENGYTPKILDILKKHNIKAAFFVTKPFIRDDIDLVKRIKKEGHVVGNHSVTHPSFPTLTDEKVKYEIQETARYMKEVTGYDMDPFFRPPMGEYSERTLYLTKKLGYKTIFWSITYKDWDLKDQPGSLYAFTHIMDNIHPGAIPLIHAVSPSNAGALDDILKALEEKGYRFGSLYELDDLNRKGKTKDVD